MDVLVGNRHVSFDRGDAIGSGGEGSIFKTRLSGEMVAIKIYEHPDVLKAEKLKAFLKNNFVLPLEVLKPNQLVYDSVGQIVGFAMPLLGKGSDEIAQLSNRKYRVSYGIHNKEVAEVFLDAARILSHIHKEGLVIGDLNSYNTFFLKGKTYWIDVDSWQFANFACPVATEEYLDPALYGIDLSKGPVFNSGNDWYSYSVLLFKSLLLVHPFGGTHRNLRLLTDRAKRSVTVLDVDVIYPKIGLSKDVLDDPLLQVFHDFFKKGWRGQFPTGVLENYCQNLIECPSCKTWYPKVRKFCPVCTTKTLVTIDKETSRTSKHDLTTEELFHTEGAILLTKLREEKIVVLSKEKGKIFLTKIGDSIEKNEVFNDLPGARYDVFNNILVVNPANSTELFLIDVSEDIPKLLEKTTTGVFAQNRKAVFRTNRSSLIRLASSTLLMRKKLASSFVERTLTSVVENQTWFWVDDQVEAIRIFGLFQVLRQQAFWVFSEKGFYELSPLPLEESEILIDISVKFREQQILLLRKTQVKGVVFLHREILTLSGEILFSERYKLQDYPFPNIHGLIFDKGVLLHATDDGIVQEKIPENSLRTFEITKPYVSGGDTLLKYGQGLLVEKEDRILYLKLT